MNLQAMLDDKFSRLSDQIRRSHEALEEQEEQEKNGNGDDEEEKWTLFSWQDGSTHVLPENFKFPNTKMSEMIELWLLGNKEKISHLYLPCLRKTWQDMVGRAEIGLTSLNSSWRKWRKSEECKTVGNENTKNGI